MHALFGLLLAGVTSGSVSVATFDRPLFFEANLGQAAPEVRYLARAGGYTLQLQPQSVVIRLQSPGPQAKSATVRMRFLGGGSAKDMQGIEERLGRANYLTGRDPRRWQTGVPLYGKVRSNEVYPGIDVVFYGRGREVEFDLVVRPGGDPKRVRMAFEGAAVEGPNASGALRLRTAAGELQLAAPIAYQLEGQSRRPVRGAYRVDRRGTVRIELERYDGARPLVVDPVLSASRFLGGGDQQDLIPPFDEERANAIAVDSAGNFYVAGSTSIDNFPIFPSVHCGLHGSTCAYQQHNRGQTDAFVTKFNAAGDLVYSTYLGGSAGDVAYGLAVDASGHAYITGRTTSRDFPTTSLAYQRESKLSPGAICVDCGPLVPTILPSSTAFVTKLNAAGTALVYSSYLGGGSDVARAIAVDDAGRAHVTGETRSNEFPVTFGAAQVALAACDGDTPCADAFVAALDPAGSALAYSTYLGGAGDDEGRGIAVDAGGNAYVTGKTASSNFATRGGCDPILGSPFPQCFDPLQDRLKGASDAFVSKIRLSGALAWSTYLGGAVEVSADAGEAGNAIAVRTRTGHGSTVTEAYVAGETTAADFPLANAFQNVHAGGASDAFVARLNSTGSGLIYSTFLGGAGESYPYPNEAARAIAVGVDGSAYVVGGTTSVVCSSPLETTFPVVRPAVAGGCPVSDRRDEAFVAKLAPAGGLQFSTLLGGTYADRAHAVALDSAGAVYVAGETQSTTGGLPYIFPTVPQAASGLGHSDAFVSKLVEGTTGSALLSIVQQATPDPSPEDADFTYDVVVKNDSGAEEASNVALVHTLSSEVELRSLATTAGECTVSAAKKVLCNFGALLPLSQVDVSIVVRPNKKAQ
jgi:hypothetical protein